MGRGAPLRDPAASQERATAALLEALQKLVDEGTVSVDRAGRSDAEPIYRVLEERRLLLDYHKNARHELLRAGGLSRARARAPRSGPSHARRRAQRRAFLSRLFKREFIFRRRRRLRPTLFDEALATLAVRGWLDVFDDGTIVVREPRRFDSSPVCSTASSRPTCHRRTLTDLRRFPALGPRARHARPRARARAFLEGDIHRPEAANRTLIESALEWLVDAGVVTKKSEGRRRRIELTEEYEGERLNALVSEIEKYL